MDMKKVVVTCACTAVACQGVFAEEPAGTRLPVTNCSQYHAAPPDKFRNPDKYLELIARDPPESIEVGLMYPFITHYGLIRGRGSPENPKDLWAPSRLSPEEIALPSPEVVKQRLAFYRRFTSGLKEAGVKWIDVYTNTRDFHIDPEGKRGVDELIARWEEYRAVLPEMGDPPAPTREWTARKSPGGEPVMWRKNNPQCLPDPFVYTQASLLNPHWRRWFRMCIRFIALSGYNAVHMDQCKEPYGSNGQYLQEGFREYLAGKYSEAEIERLFGFKTKADIVPVGPEAIGTLLYVESMRYRTQVTGEFVRMVKEEGEKVHGKGNFLVSGAAGVAHVDIALDELYSHPGTTDYNFLNGAINFRRFQDFSMLIQKRYQAYAMLPEGHRRYEYRYTTIAPRSSGPFFNRLLMAESAAFGDGGSAGFRMQPPGMYRIFRDFCTQNRAYLEGYVPAGRVGVWRDRDCDWRLYAHLLHLECAKALASSMAEETVPFDIVPANLGAYALLAPYEVIAAPSTKYMSDEQVARLAGFVNQGGTLVIDPDFATRTLLVEERTAALPWARDPGNGPYDVAFGDGDVRCLSNVITWESFRDVLTRTLGEVPRLVTDQSGNTVPGVRANVLRSVDGDHLTVHLLNYKVPLVKGTWDYINLRFDKPLRPPEKQTDLLIRIKIPPRRTVTAVTSASPDHAEEFDPVFTWEQQGDELILRVDELFIYRVFRIAL